LETPDREGARIGECRHCAARIGVNAVIRPHVVIDQEIWRPF